MTTTTTTNQLPPIPDMTPEQIAARKMIPNTFATSFGAWWSTTKTVGRDAEERLLKRLPFNVEYADDLVSASKKVATADLVAKVYPVHYAPPSSTTKSSSFLPALWKSSGDDAEKFINTIKISNGEVDDSREAVVMLHGYGAGSGFY
jgi:hypothetical protein